MLDEAYEKYYGVLAYVAKNPNTPSETLAALAIRNDEPDIDYICKANVLENPGAPENLLEIMSRSGDKEDRMRVAGNPSTAEQALGRQGPALQAGVPGLWPLCAGLRPRPVPGGGRQKQQRQGRSRPGAGQAHTRQYDPGLQGQAGGIGATQAFHGQAGEIGAWTPQHSGSGRLAEVRRS